jgi:hypothetical protein
MPLALFAEPEDDEDLADEEIAALEDAEVARATKAGASVEDDERAKSLLDEMTKMAEAARDRPDAKIRAFIAWMHANQVPGVTADGAPAKGSPKWSSRRALIFTEYADTKNYLVHQLEAAIASTDRAEDRILVLHGGMDEDDREVVKQAFNDAAHPVRILIATDAAREGVNLQAQCSDLFHFDLPWNPGRMEQRNGRIDRMLQPEDQVRCHYFVYAQRPEDAVLEALAQKSERIHEELGSLADVIDQRLAKTLRQGISRGTAKELVLAIQQTGREVETTRDREDTVEDELESARDKEVAAQLEQLGELYQKARDHLDLAPERLRDVVNLGLSLAGSKPLVPRTKPAGSFDVPDVEKLAATDPSWREVVDTLRPPRPRKLSVWEWRSTVPPRPVSFQPSTTLAAESVQLHLQHRLTQKALGQFRAQGFAEDRLSRVTVVFDPTHARKRVLALGRLSLYGAGAARLHEEILATAAFWVEGDDRTRLEPFTTADAEEKAQRALDAVLALDQPPVPEHIVSLIMRTAPKDEDVLWEKVKGRALQRIAFADESLRRRAKVESDEMTRILEAQRAAIGKELGRRSVNAAQASEGVQLAMPWMPEEKPQKEQYDADTKYIQKRLGELEYELSSEPARIRDLYEVKHHRLERVGLVYLWPTTA